jgi:hypothetical protein
MFIVDAHGRAYLQLNYKFFNDHFQGITQKSMTSKDYK